MVKGRGGEAAKDLDVCTCVSENREKIEETEHIHTL